MRWSAFIHGAKVRLLNIDPQTPNQATLLNLISHHTLSSRDYELVWTIGQIGPILIKSLQRTSKDMYVSISFT